jgi:hypothetical protein
MFERPRIFIPTGSVQRQGADEQYVCMARLLLEESVHLALSHTTLLSYILYPLPVNV